MAKITKEFLRQQEWTEEPSANTYTYTVVTNIYVDDKRLRVCIQTWYSHYRRTTVYHVQTTGTRYFEEKSVVSVRDIPKTIRRQVEKLIRSERPLHDGKAELKKFLMIQ